ncbi:glycine zipper 2TM domain-containing protein [Photobacterium nomapromontoriensis]|uniref:glycine zipper 2TM domain-containing protein n=1 Tax=Photobacterium nomapromontoriensis TaxID=2910237 RepID=UPI003D14320D
MNKNVLVSLLVVTTLGLGLTGCAQNPYGNAYNVSDARQIQTVLTGTITKLDAVTIQGDAGNTIGTIAGGAIGALLGSEIGGGTGSAIAAIGGGVVGSMVGSKTGQAADTSQGVNIVIQLDSGRTIAIVQQVNPDVIFSVGERVDIYQQGSTARVVPAS